MKGCLLLKNPSEVTVIDGAAQVLATVFGKNVAELNGIPVGQVTWQKLAGQNVSATL